MKTSLSNLRRSLVKNRKTKIDNYILFVGRLVPEKSIDNLIKSMSFLKNIENINLNIVGDGFQMEYLKGIVEKEGISNYVTFHGWQNNLTPFYQKAHIFVLPSYIEGAPSALYEAMSFGIPSIISDLDLAPEDSIIKIKRNNPKEISEKILSLLDNPVLAKDLSEKSRKIAKTVFNRNLMAQRHIDVYTSLST